MRVVLIFALLFCLSVCFIGSVQCKSKSSKTTESSKAVSKSQGSSVGKHKNRHRDGDNRQKGDSRKDAPTPSNINHGKPARNHSSFLKHERETSSAFRLEDASGKRNNSGLPSLMDRNSLGNKFNATRFPNNPNHTVPLFNVLHQRKNNFTFHLNDSFSNKSEINSRPKQWQNRFNQTIINRWPYRNITIPEGFNSSTIFNNKHSNRTAHNSTNVRHPINMINKSSTVTEPEYPKMRGSSNNYDKANPKFNSTVPPYGWKEWNKDYRSQFLSQEGKVKPVSQIYDKTPYSGASAPLFSNASGQLSHPNHGWNVNTPIKAHTSHPFIDHFAPPPPPPIGWHYQPSYSKPEFNHFQNYDPGYSYYSKKKDKKKKKKKKFKFDMSLEDWSLEDLSIEKEDIREALKNTGKNLFEKLKALHDRRLIGKLPTRRLYTSQFPKVKQRLNLEPFSGKGIMPNFTEKAFTGYFTKPYNPKIFAGLESEQNYNFP